MITTKASSLRLRCCLIGLAGALEFIGPSVPTSANEASRLVTDAPATWVEYAGKLRAQAEAVLGADDKAARSFRDDVARSSAATASGAVNGSDFLAINIWVGADGPVERATLIGLPNANMNAILTALLSRASAGPPPADMLQPVRLRLRLGAKQ